MNLLWLGPYELGTLVAKGIKGGKVLCWKEEVAAGIPAKKNASSVFTATISAGEAEDAKWFIIIKKDDYVQ